MFTPLPFNVRRPMVDVWTASALSGESPRDILDAITEGRVRFAFNISSPETRRRCVRILTRSLHDYINGTVPPARDDTRANLLAALNDIFPALSQTIGAGLLQRTLGCDLNLLMELRRAGVLVPLNKVRPGPGPTCAAQFSRRGVIDFLVSRRVLP